MPCACAGAEGVRRVPGFSPGFRGSPRRSPQLVPGTALSPPPPLGPEGGPEGRKGTGQPPACSPASGGGGVRGTSDHPGSQRRPGGDSGGRERLPTPAARRSLRAQSPRPTPSGPLGIPLRQGSAVGPCPCFQPSAPDHLPPAPGSDRPQVKRAKRAAPRRTQDGCWFRERKQAFQAPLSPCQPRGRRNRPAAHPSLALACPWPCPLFSILPRKPNFYNLAQEILFYFCLF